MPEPFRIRLKVGPHEFEAEGDQETVERQFALWRELIAQPTASSPPPPTPPDAPPANGNQVPSAGASSADAEALKKIFKQDGRIVSLTASPRTGPADAALLILLGQKIYRQEDQVTGAMVTDGLAHTGYPVERADRVLNRYISGADALVLRTGLHRATRYRLNNPGYQRALQLAKELAATMP